MNRRFVLVLILIFSHVISAYAEERGFMLSDYRIRPDAIEYDIFDIATYGGTLVRFPMYMHPDYSDDDNLNYWLPLAHRAEYACWLTGTELVILAHTLPFDPYTQPERFAAMWSRIATSFRAHGATIRYELLNEPRVDRRREWRAAAEMAAAAIARADTNNEHKIVYGVPGIDFAYCDGFRPLQSVPFKRQWITAHCYVWNRTQQFKDNGRYPSGDRNHSRLRREFRRLSDLRKQFPGIDVYVGEIAFHRDAPGAEAFLDDALSLCYEFDIHASIHAFREAPQWNYEPKRRLWRGVELWLILPD